MTYIKKTNIPGYINPTFLKTFSQVKECLNQGSNLSQKLETWITSQRRQYINGKLPPEKMTLLESLGVSLVCLHDLNWEKDFQVYKHFKNQDPDFKPKKRRHYSPAISVEYYTTNLTSWIHTQRAFYKDKTLSQNRIDKLNSIGFQWTVDPEHKYFDYEKCTALTLNFVAKKGRLPKSNENYHGIAIGIWLKRVKFYFKNNDVTQSLSNDYMEVISVLTPII